MDAPPPVICEVEAAATTSASAALGAQVAAWNRGDLEGALSAYWQDADIRWVHRRGTETGFEAFASEMRSSFSDSSRMGRFSADVLFSEQLRCDLALLVTNWRIDRDGERLMGGVSTQLWRNIDGAWRIVFEHAG